MALAALLMTVALNAENECVCFELKGEFGDEIKAILQKYSKNLGSKDIKVVREDSDLTVAERSFLESLMGSAKVSAPAGGKAYDLEMVNDFMIGIAQAAMGSMLKSHSAEKLRLALGNLKISLWSLGIIN